MIRKVCSNSVFKVHSDARRRAILTPASGQDWVDGHLMALRPKNLNSSGFPLMVGMKRPDDKQVQAHRQHLKCCDALRYQVKKTA